MGDLGMEARPYAPLPPPDPLVHIIIAQDCKKGLRIWSVNPVSAIERGFAGRNAIHFFGTRNVDWECNPFKRIITDAWEQQISRRAPLWMTQCFCFQWPPKSYLRLHEVNWQYCLPKVLYRFCQTKLVFIFLFSKETNVEMEWRNHMCLFCQNVSTQMRQWPTWGL